MKKPKVKIPPTLLATPEVWLLSLRFTLYALRFLLFATAAVSFKEQFIIYNILQYFCPVAGSVSKVVPAPFY